MSHYERDVDDDNPGMDSNHEYQEPDCPDDYDYNYSSYHTQKQENLRPRSPAAAAMGCLLPILLFFVLVMLFSWLTF